MKIKSRFVCEEVRRNQYGESVTFRAVDKTGSLEDVSFAEATPSGSIEIYISNAAVHGFYKPGQRYDVTFEPTPE